MTDKVCVAAGCDGTARGGSHVCIRHWKMLDSDTRAEVFDLKSQARDRVISWPEMERLLREAFARHFPVKTWPEFPALQAMTCAGCGTRTYRTHGGPLFDVEEWDSGGLIIYAGNTYIPLFEPVGLARFRPHDCRGNRCHERG